MISLNIRLTSTTSPRPQSSQPAAPTWDGATYSSSRTTPHFTGPRYPPLAPPTGGSYGRRAAVGPSRRFFAAELFGHCAWRCGYRWSQATHLRSELGDHGAAHEAMLTPIASRLPVTRSLHNSTSEATHRYCPGLHRHVVFQPLWADQVHLGRQRYDAVLWSYLVLLG